MKTAHLLLMLFSIFLFSCNSSRDASYSARVWEDVNANGQQDLGEKPLAGIVIQIADAKSGSLWSRSVTDKNGDINELNAGGQCGDYAMYVSVPIDYWPTTKIMSVTANCETAYFGLRPYP